ncbi:hypothetical protein K1719_035220 [Acacia pycnantha]|nr:hypothetical protein K1719_035220 [Acacia pycnantha]
MTIDIMVLLAIATIAEIPKNFHGMNLASSVAPAVIQRVHRRSVRRTEIQSSGDGLTMVQTLGKLIKLMVDESDPKLPFGCIKLDEMASRAKMNSPPLRTLMSAIHKVIFCYPIIFFL